MRSLFEDSKFRFFHLFFVLQKTPVFQIGRKKRERERDKVRGEKEKATIQMSGVITRAQKRRIGQRDLWDVIVNNDDVCFKHILPRLSGTDIKFLYDVNGETRALIKRSSRMGKLKRGFKVHKMSSISTLEFAWDNVQWGMKDRKGLVMDQARFCCRVAATNKLELLKWIREEKKCEWDARTTRAASCQGNLEMIKYCVANECPMAECACAWAALNGHLECLKYLHEEVGAPWDHQTATHAALNGHLHILEYLVERKYDEFVAPTCFFAAGRGDLDCLKFLYETAKAPWNSYAVQQAYYNNHSECLQYLLDNDCPLPRGWRYEHGTIFTS